MGFFHSPIKLIQVICSVTKNDFLFAKNAEWFLSDKGRAVYEKYNGYEKTYFFYNYLNATSKLSRDDKSKVAIFMSECLLGTSCEFGNYPNILSYSKNPVLNAINGESHIPSALKILNKLRAYFGKEAVESYTDLTSPDDAENVELFKLEQYIIWFFNGENLIYPENFSENNINGVEGDN